MELTEVDLFGVVIADPPQQKQRGYIAPPGTGPNDETCSSCRFFCRVKYSKTYFKCELMYKGWTHGYGTDIKARSPACRCWQPPNQDNYLPLNKWDETPD